jgi:hypothetical protein
MCKQTRTKDHTICDIELGNNPGVELWSRGYPYVHRGYTLFIGPTIYVRDDTLIDVLVYVV